MKKYVTCIAFNESMTKVILLRKNNKYEFLAGKLMPPGGAIEDGEDMFEASVREFYEECGIHTKISDWKYISSLIVSKNYEPLSECSYLKAVLPDDVIETARTMETEEVSIVKLTELNITSLDADILCMIASAYSLGCDMISIGTITRHILV